MPLKSRSRKRRGGLSCNDSLKMQVNYKTMTNNEKIKFLKRCAKTQGGRRRRRKSRKKRRKSRKNKKRKSRRRRRR